MDREGKEINLLLRKIAAVRDDFWLAYEAIRFILFEYGEQEIISAIISMPRRDQIKIADKLHELKEEAFTNGFSLKLKGIEKGINSRCLRYFWGYQWVMNTIVALGCLIAWMVGKFFNVTHDYIQPFALMWVFGYLFKLYYDVFRQNELLLQHNNKNDLEKEKSWLKTQLKGKKWIRTEDNDIKLV